jgi:hypothetical protein
MQANPLHAIIHPVKTIESALEKPDFDKAFFIVLMPTVLFAIFQLVSGLKLDIFELARYGASHYIAWIFIASVIYFFAFLAKGKAIKGKFSAILSAASVIWLLVSVLMVVAFITFYSSPKILGFIVAMRNEDATPDEISTIYNMLSNRDEKALESFTKAHDIKANLTPYMLTESESSTFYLMAFLALLVFTLLMAYCLVLYPFITLKKLTKFGNAASFVLYIITGILIVPCLLLFVFHI